MYRYNISHPPLISTTFYFCNFPGPHEESIKALRSKKMKEESYLPFSACEDN